MFAGITANICATAWRVIVPAIEAAAEAGITNGLRGTVVVLDPAKAEPTVIYTAYLGEEDPKTLKYATAKAAVTLRTGLASSRVAQDYPYLYQPGDIKWPGAVIRHGLVVAFSGVQGEFDEMISEWMVSAIRAITRDELNRPGGRMSQDGAFLER